MNIGVIGRGKVGNTLGGTWAKKGHRVLFGSRTPVPGQSVSWREALAPSQVILLSIPGQAVDEQKTLDAMTWKDKIIIDATNRFDGISNLAVLERLGPGVKVVRAFNSVGFEVMAHPEFSGTAASMLFAGEDSEAKSLVAKLIQDIGFDPVDLGDASAIPVLNDFVRGIWFPLTKTWGRRVAIRVLREG
jgi:hypothetical protein